MSKFNEPDFKTALIQLAATVAGMVGYIEEQIIFTLEGFAENNPVKRLQTLSHTPHVRHLSSETIQRVIETLVQFKPKGDEAKLVLASWKIASSLERISLIIHNVAQDMGNIQNTPNIQFSYAVIKNISDNLMAQTYDMVVAYTTKKTDRLADIDGKQKNISLIYQNFFRQSLDFLIQNPAEIHNIEKLLDVTKKLDIIGTYIKEIAEQLAYKNSFDKK